MDLATVILAAGQGTRMKSKTPKVLHPVAGRPMVRYSLDTASSLGSAQTVLVVGHEAEAVRRYVGDAVSFAEQREQRGTGHAVLQALPALKGHPDTVLVIYGDMPLLRVETLRRLVETHAASHATITMLTVTSDDSMGFGRILRNAEQRVLGIVEESDATPQQLAIQELNCGVYCFKTQWLWDHLPRLTPSGKKSEYYLTDLIGMAAREERKIESIVLTDVSEVIGINTRVHLAQAERIMRERINTRWMNEGVTFADPTTTYVDADVEIGPDSTVQSGTHLSLRTHIGAQCTIGPNVTIVNSKIGDNCQIGPNSMIIESQVADDCEVVASVLEEAVLERGVHVGPFAHLRPGSQLEKEVYIGNYTEIKNSRLAEGVHAGHFSYIGDSEIGPRVNVGAGTITCNFDGEKKNRTVVEEDVFVGSDTMLVAPVRVGARSRTGAGSVVTKDVPPDSVAAGVPARVIRKLR